MPGTSHPAQTDVAEVAPLGIHVTVVESGSFRTDFASLSLASAASRLDDNRHASGAMLDYYRRNAGQESGDPPAPRRQSSRPSMPANHHSRLVLGADALEGIRAKLARVADECAEWEDVTRAAAFCRGMVQPVSDTTEGVAL
jgi:hypothetical protein